MARLSVASKASAEERIEHYLDTHVRRIEAMPPGTCPLAVQLSLLRACEAQTCGKCVPCRDGIPHLAELLERVVACEADETAVASMKTLAEMIRDTSDCAIGYEAAASVLDGLDAFEDEYRSHTLERACADGVGQTVPCETLCPAHVDVPAYIALTANGDCAGAVAMVRKDNPFPTACAYVCEHPCETRCRRTLIDAPVNIRGIKKYAVDQAPADTVATPKRGADTGRTIAVVGAGPSGLTCAYFLSLMGHRVTVFEAREQPGGMLRYGIPAYRFPRERLDEDIRGILSVGGIDVRCGEPVGSAEMQELTERFDAVYVAIGAQAGKALRVDNAKAEGVISAVDLLREIGDGSYPDFSGKSVAVVGGGNVAMDCARTSVRAGAREVTVVYRRRKDDMTALAAEVESAVAEGIEMMELESPVGVEVDENGCCCALVTQPQMIGAVKDGRPAPIAADKPPSRIEAEVVLMAVGQGIVSEPFEEFGMKTLWGQFEADEYLQAEGHEGLFVGGDCQTGPSSVIRAIGAGKVAARNIDEYLGFHHSLDCCVSVPDPALNNRTPTGRVEITERPARVRKRDFSCVEGGMSYEKVVQECGRCLRCDRFGCGVLEGGRERYE